MNNVFDIRNYEQRISELTDRAKAGNEYSDDCDLGEQFYLELLSLKNMNSGSSAVMISSENKRLSGKGLKNTISGERSLTGTPGYKTGAVLSLPKRKSRAARSAKSWYEFLTAEIKLRAKSAEFRAIIIKRR